MPAAPCRPTISSSSSALSSIFGQQPLPVVIIVFYFFLAFHWGGLLLIHMYKRVFGPALVALDGGRYCCGVVFRWLLVLFLFLPFGNLEMFKFQVKMLRFFCVIFFSLKVAHKGTHMRVHTYIKVGKRVRLPSKHWLISDIEVNQ